MKFGDSMKNHNEKFSVCECSVTNTIIAMRDDIIFYLANKLMAEGHCVIQAYQIAVWKVNGMIDNLMEVHI